MPGSVGSGLPAGVRMARPGVSTGSSMRSPAGRTSGATQSMRHSDSLPAVCGGKKQHDSSAQLSSAQLSSARMTDWLLGMNHREQACGDIMSC
jgi:hypothetical protein